MTTEELQGIPPFLDRRIWTEEQWAAHRKAEAALVENARRIQAEHRAARRAAIRDKEEAQAEKILKRKQTRDEEQQRAIRREARKAARRCVLMAIEAGHETFGQIRTATKLPDNVISNTLYWLRERGSVKKASARRYTT